MTRCAPFAEANPHMDANPKASKAGGSKQQNSSTKNGRAGHFAPTNGGAHDDARARQGRAREEYATPRFSFQYPEDFKPMPRKWLVQKVVPERALGVAFGPSGVGKSTFITALCCSVATGAPFLGRQCKTGGVIYVGCEDAEGVMYRREAWIVENGADRASMAFAIIPEAPDLWSIPSEGGADIDVLIEQIKAEKWIQRERGAETRIVVLDTSRKAFPGMKEIDSAEVDRMCRIARRIITECDVSVLFASHVAVAGSGDDPRGSGGYIGDVDFALGMKIDGGTRQVWVRKMRNGKAADADESLRWAYHLKTVDLGFVGEDGEPESAAVFHESNEPPAAAKQKERKISAGARLVISAVHELLSENRGVTPPPTAQCPRGQLAVKVSDALKRARDKGISIPAESDDPQEKRRAQNASATAFRRGKLEAIDRKKLFELDEWLWPGPA